MIRTNVKIATGHIFTTLAMIVRIFIMPAPLLEIGTVMRYDQ